MYLSSSLSLCLSFSLFVVGQVITVIKCLKGQKSHRSLFGGVLKIYLSLSLSLSFCWSGHVFSSLWSNASMVKSHKDRSLEVFSKYIFNCLCLCHCLFVGQVMFPHHSDQMSQWLKVPKIALWRCSLNVFVIVIVFVFVFVVVLLVRSCFCMTPISFARFRFGLEGRKALNPTQSVSQWVSYQGRPRDARTAKNQQKSTCQVFNVIWY